MGQVIMKKSYIIVFAFISIISTCYSIPTYIQNNRVELSPEQKVRERPDSLSFNPLQVGNKWWYRLEGDGNPVFVGREVVDSMLSNNHVYYRVTGFGAGSNYWIRNEGDITMVLDSMDIDNNTNTSELVNEDFTIRSEAMVYHDFTFFGNNPWQCILLNESYLSAFSIPTSLRWHHYYFPYDHNSLSVIKWARGFGFLSFELLDSFEPCFIYAVACRINGIIYGDESVVHIEDNVLNTNTITAFNYPNPFIDNINIEYALSKSSDVNVSVFNLKGQRVKNLINGIQAKGNHRIVWNGTDENGKSVSSGVYFYRLTTPDKVITNKMIMLK